MWEVVDPCYRSSSSLCSWHAPVSPVEQLHSPFRACLFVLLCICSCWTCCARRALRSHCPSRLRPCLSSCLGGVWQWLGGADVNNDETRDTRGARATLSYPAALSKLPCLHFHTKFKSVARVGKRNPLNPSLQVQMPRARTQNTLNLHAEGHAGTL